MARKYARDNRGRFSSKGGGKGKGATPPPPPPKPSNADYKRAAAGAKAKASVKASKGPANKVVPSPKRFNAAEKAYAEILQQPSKFRSDRQRRAELQRQGFLKGKDVQGEAIRLARSVRVKAGIEGKPTMSTKDKRAALARMAGIKPAKRKGK